MSKVKARAALTRARRFYEDALNEAERARLPQALKVEGVDEELALLRLLLRQALANRPEDLALMFRGLELITRTVAAKYRLAAPDKRSLDECLQRAVDGIAAGQEGVDD